MAQTPTRLACVVVVGAALSMTFAACGGSASSSALPAGTDPTNLLIVLDQSIGGVSLDEPRKLVERALGPGRSTQRGLVSYFGGRLVVDYWFHDGLTTHVQELSTTWSGFHTRSGVHVGATRQALRPLHLDCTPALCSHVASPKPDAAGTGFTVRHGKVTEIEVGYS